MIDLRLGDCIEGMNGLPDNSVDAVVTDPPYELGFMGRSWDKSGIAFSAELWQEVYRVLKPGGHLLSFGGSRTWHRIAVAIEDTGFEIRDSIAWIYGQGFPKSLDIGRAIDKAAFSAPLFDTIRAHIRCWRDKRGMTNRQLNEAVGSMTNGCGMARHWTSEEGGQHSIPSKDQWAKLKTVLCWGDCELDTIYEQVKDGAERPVVGTAHEGGKRSIAYLPTQAQDYDITAPATETAKKWDGWGTALKPAIEPVIVARKPLSEPTVAANVLAWGAGGLNIDGCRIGTTTLNYRSRGAKGLVDRHYEQGDRPYSAGLPSRQEPETTAIGRFPANVILDEVAAAALDEQSDGASRFFYVAKAPQSERWFYCKTCGTAHPVSERASHEGHELNQHPTQKPLQLMRYLVRLVTPPDGTVLDPFTGSGTTGAACLQEGFHFIGFEREADYFAVAKARTDQARQLSLV